MYINNPQDVIELNPEIEGEKKLHGLKIYQAIQTVRDFAAALAYRLGPDGDLYGRREYMEKEPADSQSESSPDSASGQADETNQSILDELDDIL
jgi:hypothetical protein